MILFISDATEFVQGCPVNGMYRFDRMKAMGDRAIALPNVVPVNFNGIFRLALTHCPLSFALLMGIFRSSYDNALK